jgi:hypothetical protein
MAALQPGGAAPYTTAVSVTTLMDAYRDRGLGTPITPAVVTRAGVSETVAARTLNSLKTLGLVDENGSPTEQFDSLRQVRDDDEYHARLQEWVRGVYADVLQYTDPSKDSAAKIAGAFRTYEPGGQRPQMAALLIGLWRYAGLPVAEATTTPSERRTPRPPKQRHTPSSETGRTQRNPSRQEERDHSVQGGTNAIAPALLGLLREVPREGGWSQERRDAFLETFRVVLNFTVPIASDDVIVDNEEVE